MSTQIRFPKRPVAGKARIQTILFRVRTREFFAFPALRIPSKPTELCVNRPPAPPRKASASPLRARARHSQAAALHPHSRAAPLCSASFFASRISPLNGQSGGCYSGLYLSCGPPPTRGPTHALGSWPSLASDRFAVSASRNPKSTDFSDVLHEHTPLCPLDSALCSPSCTSA